MGLFDKRQTVNRANIDYVKGLQDDRAAGTLGMSEGQKENMVARGLSTAGAATQAMLSQMPPGTNPAQQQALMRTAASGLQNTTAQLSQGADLASEQQAANRAAELAAQEQGLFQRRAAKRQFWADIIPAGIQAVGMGIEACWVAVELWGECERTQNARLHCRLSHGWFYRLYERNGRAWARWLRAHPWAKPLVAPLWHYFAWRGERRFNDSLLHAITHADDGQRHA